MLFHLSIDADEPARVARVLAKLMGGEALPLGSVEDGWIARGGDGGFVEVYPRGTLLALLKGDHDAEAHVDEFARWIRGSATRFATATEMTLSQVTALAEREGWTAKYRRRPAGYGVIELWLENERLVEVLTRDLQAEYRAAMAPAACEEARLAA